MAATPFHDQDEFDLDIQRIKDDTDFAIYGPKGGVGTDDNIERLFYDGFERPRNSALAHDVLKTDRWNMRGTTVAFADRVGTDHGTISKWYRHGILPPWLERYLMACPWRPSDWEAPIVKVFNARHRSAFMSVASYLAGKMPGRPSSAENKLGIVDTEILFDILHLEERKRWEAARKEGDPSMAAEVVQSVCDPSDRQIAPFWLTKKQAAEVSRLIRRLRKDDRFALKYICLLQRRWEGIFILTRSATQGMGWLP